jgi:GT2 family glycosyltransferase
MSQPACDISVIILTCGAPQTTISCLESLLGPDSDRLQMLVVNNGGGPAVGAALETFAADNRLRLGDMRILTNPRNVGACSGRNQALPLADGRYVAFLDNDTISATASWLHDAVVAMEEDPGLGVVGPRILTHAMPVRLECAGYAVSPRGDVQPLGRGAEPTDSRWRTRRQVQAMGNFLARTDAVRAIGGFDTAFDPFGFENIDCCLRLRQLGLVVQCDGQADLYHVGHVTTGQFDQAGRRMLLEKSLLLRRRWRPWLQQDATAYDALMDITQSAEDVP